MIGIDIIQISRIEKFIDRFGERGLSRFLSKDEVLRSRKKISRIAGYWATKEAISKALGVGIGREFSFQDVEIDYDNYGRPLAKLSNRVLDRFSIEDIAISITHDGDYAVAVATIQIGKSSEIN